MIRRLRNYFITGTIIIFPLFGTVYVLVLLFRTLDGILGGLIQRYAGISVPGLGLVATLALVLITGLVGTNFIGRRFIAAGERILERIPIARSVYVTLKQVIDSFVSQDRNAFKQVVLVEYPRKGVYSVGFLTGAAREEAQITGGQKMLNVFLPSTPNPTTGWLLLVPEDQIVPVDLSVENGLKLVISAGMVNGGPKVGDR